MEKTKLQLLEDITKSILPDETKNNLIRSILGGEYRDPTDPEDMRVPTFSLIGKLWLYDQLELCYKAEKGEYIHFS
jgi:hypothetical protein